MKRIYIYFFIFITACSQNKYSEICFKDRCFEIEKAITPKDRVKGLMFRNKLKEDRGMLFVFSNEEKHGFWMKNTSIPLDIIWIDENKKVIFIKENAKPCKEEICPVLYPSKKAKYVLELNAGKTFDGRIKIGDYVSFNAIN